MQLGPFAVAGIDWLGCARRRYENRPLFCRLPRPPISSSGELELTASGPVEPGRSLLVRLEGPGERNAPTLLARVARVTRRADGSWQVRCRLAGTPGRPKQVPSAA